MERPNKLAGLTLVTKHLPVANYSYPRTDTAGPYSAATATPTTGAARTASQQFRQDRSSLGSEGSAPGLIEDRTDSEVSVDDDYQYHAHGAELWDSFWQAGVVAEGRVERSERVEEKMDQDKASAAGESAQHPSKQYPALIPSPFRKKRQPVIGGRPRPSWPLPNSPPSETNGRKAAATYSPFPRPAPQPRLQQHQSSAPRATTTTPSPTGPAPSTPPRKPQRPARPDSKLLTPCIQQQAKVPAVIAPAATIRVVPGSTSRPSTPCEQQCPTLSADLRPSTATDYRPKMSLDYARPKMSLDQQRPSRSLDGGPSSAPMRTSNPFYSYTAASNSATNLAASEPKSKVRAPRSYKSTTHLSAAAAAAAAKPAPTEPEPHSVFELDDSDNESDFHGLSFFRFHKRTDSETRRITKSSDQAAAVAPSSSAAQRRARANTAPSSPPRQGQDRHGKDDASSRKKQGGDVLGRMLGRRSR